MDPYQNGMVFSPDGEQGADMGESFHSETTVRGNSFEQVQEELLQSLGHHGISYAHSLGSSERYEPYERYDPSNPALTVTSGTTWTDIDPSGSSTFPTGEVAPQCPIPPVETQVAGMMGGSEVDQDFIDALEVDQDFLDALLQHERISPTSIPPRQSIARGALMGLTRETQPRVSHQPAPENALTQAIEHVDDFSRKVLSHTECSPDLLHQTKQSLVHLTEHVNNLLQNHENHLTAPCGPPAPPSSTGSTPVARYKCQECNVLDTRTRGTFTRHVNDMHFPSRKFFCPEKGCHDVWKPRKHQIRTHVVEIHKRMPTDGEILRHKRDMPCPHQCPGCSLPIRTWNQFTKCYLEHCTYEASSNAGVASRRGSADHGNGRKKDGPKNDQPMQGIGMGNPGPAHPHCASNSTKPGRYPHFFSEAIGPTNPTARPQGASHRTPDDWARRNAGPNHSQGNVPQPHNPRNPTPGAAGHEMARRLFGAINGGTQDMSPCASRQEPDLGCRRCPHKFHNCLQCRNRTESTPFCHQCPDFHRIVAGIRMQLGHDPLPGQQAYGPTIDPSLLTPGYQPQPGISQDTQEHFPSQNQQGRGPQFQGWTFHPGMGSTYSGTRRNNPGNNHMAMLVTNIDETGLSEQEMEIPSVFGLKDTKLQGSLLSMLPMMDPLKNWFSKPLKGLSSLALSGLDFITQIDEPPSTIAAVNPSGECKCVCRARARAELASGRQVEMKFKLSPQYRGTSHLRTRVDIVVKLLKLRSSVSKSKAKREEAKSAITHAFEPDVSEESDTESVFDEDDNDALTTSSSCPDLMSLIPATAKPSASACPDIPSDDSLLPLHDVEGEETSEGDILIELNFDVESILYKLSKWTGGDSGDIFSDMCISDPGRVFEYLTAYILYVIMSLARSRDYGQPHLDD